MTNIGIDIGTSFSCVAIYNEKKQDSEIVKIIGDNGLIPSIVLYSEGRPIAFGSMALEKFACEKDSEVYIIREFKMRFGDRINLGNHRIESEDVYEGFLKYIRDQIEKSSGLELEDEYEKFDLSEHRVCITYPAQDDDGRDWVGNRIQTIAGRIFKGFTITRMDEPSAVVQYLDRKKAFLSINPKNVLVVDSGGGTTDFAVALAQYNWQRRKKQPLTVKFTRKLDIGGRNIDEAIYTLALSKIRVNDMNIRIKEDNLKFIREVKHGYDWINQPVMEIKIGTEKVTLSGDDVISCVEPVINEIISGAKKCFDCYAEDSKWIDRIVLTGGNSRVPLLRASFEEMIMEIKEKYPARFTKKLSLIHVEEEDLKTSVAKGAALFAQKSNDTIKYDLSYDIYLRYSDHFKEKLWSRGAKIPDGKIKERPIPPGDNIILFVDSENTVYEESLIVSDLNKDNIVALEIDGDGFLRYSIIPMLDGGINESKSHIELNIIDRFLINLIPPNWK